jgi:RNA binding exosome subunit
MLDARMMAIQCHHGEKINILSQRLLRQSVLLRNATELIGEYIGKAP